MIIGRVIGGNPVTPKSYVLVTEDGREIPGVLAGEQTVFTATANDIREGKIAGSEGGVITGEKIIPAYHTCEGIRLIASGKPMNIPNHATGIDYYDYTKLQAIVCPYNTSINNSVAAEKVSIENKVYNVQSTESISEVTKDHDNKMILLGVNNELSTPCIIRYFSYKEIE